jgi:glycosyltransferase involved in cell wall biosynthesis
MKKILFICNEGSFTGAPLFLARLLRHVREHRSEYEIAVFFAKPGRLVDDLTKEGFNVFLSKKHNESRTRLGALWCRIAHYFKYLKVLSEYRPTLVYSNTIVNFGEVIISRLLGIRVIMHMHEGENFASAYRFRLIISTLFASRIIVGSQYVNRVLFKITKRQGCVVYNGIDINTCSFKTERTNGNCLTLGMLGTIDPNKGQLIAIKAVNLLIQEGLHVTLTIAGIAYNKIYEEQLHTYIDQNLLQDHIHFVGHVQDSSEYLKALDVFLVPSFDEALPTVILEALAKGTIVIASNVGGIPEIICHNVNGLLVAVDDEVELAKMIRKAMENPEIKSHFHKENIRVLKIKFDINDSNKKLTSELDASIKALTQRT